MKYVRLSFIAVFALVGLLLGCDKDPPPIEDLESFSFPHQEGTEWIYRYETFAGISYEKYIIKGVANHEYAGEAGVIEHWLLVPDSPVGGFIGYSFIRVADNEVRIYDDLNEDHYRVLLKFPLEVGKAWVYRPNDTHDSKATVLRVEDCAVEAGTFEDCWVIEYYEFDYSFDEATNNIVWYAVGVGGPYGVKADLMGNAELISYNLPDK
ncbi:MAG: hypothetical protein JSW52_00815 [Candidatus Coatesbacteria bacterium]|nr:MAG: hypothetical protein JSW52_00815 [Candidatus Coatesbacteria bacterium]